MTDVSSRQQQQYHPLVLTLLLLLVVTSSSAFSSDSHPSSFRRINTSVGAVEIEGFDEAFQEIDRCSVTGQASEKLYDAVRFVDKNARFIYPTLEEKQALWQQAFGSWKLVLATGGGRFTTFKSVPIFAFAMIDPTYFGNGIGINQDFIILSLLGPHYFNAKIRQMVITIDDIFLVGGNNVTSNLPPFLASAIGLGKKPQDFDKNKRPPAFTIIGASQKSLIARGGSGGIAIWTRLDNDIRSNAYKMDPLQQ
jgi:hypothetical protein